MHLCVCSYRGLRTLHSRFVSIFRWSYHSNKNIHRCGVFSRYLSPFIREQLVLASFLEPASERFVQVLCHFYARLWNKQVFFSFWNILDIKVSDIWYWRVWARGLSVKNATPAWKQRVPPLGKSVCQHTHFQTPSKKNLCPAELLKQL